MTSETMKDLMAKEWVLRMEREEKSPVEIASLVRGSEDDVQPYLRDAYESRYHGLNCRSCETELMYDESDGSFFCPFCF